MATVTVVVPVYNMPQYLPRCFESIRAQSFSDWEAILVDDGSTDSSPRICDEWAAKDPRFRVIHKPNGGVCSARNAGIDAANSPYVVLMDQDDLLSPVLLEALLEAQENNPKAFCLCLHTEERDQLAQALPASQPILYTARQAGHLYNRAPFPPPWAKLFQKSLLQEHSIRFDEAIRDGYEDRPFMREYLAALWETDTLTPCVVVQAPLYFWERGNVGSVSQSGHQPLKPWHLSMFDTFLQDCLTVYKTPPVSLQFYMMQYIQTLAFSISCLPAQSRQADAAWIYSTPEYDRLLAYFRDNRIYSVFYLPFKYRRTELIARLSRGRLENDAFYWRLYKLGRLLHPFWRDWQGIDAIPAD